MDKLAYRFAADAVVVIHFAYAAFVVLALPAIYVGLFRGQQWARNMKFRVIHLAMILLVVAESWLGITCPLTTLEKHLRERAGQTSYEGDFIANAVHELLFFDAEPWVFTLLYTAFAGLVLGTFLIKPKGHAGPPIR